MPQFIIFVSVVICTLQQKRELVCSGALMHNRRTLNNCNSLKVRYFVIFLSTILG